MRNINNIYVLKSVHGVWKYHSSYETLKLAKMVVRNYPGSFLIVPKFLVKKYLKSKLNNLVINFQSYIIVRN